MRRLALVIMVVSAFSLADVTFGFQETDKPKDKKATAAKARKADRAQPAPAVTARGQIESSTVCDVRCKVLSIGKGGVLIRKIVPEGTLVKQGEFLVEFEAPGIEEQEVQQQMACNVSEAGVIKSQNEYEAVVIEKEAYVEGAFKIAKLEAELAVFVLEETLRRAEEEFAVIGKAAETGPVSKSKLEATKFAVAKAQKELDLAHTRLEVLQKYTFVTTLKQLDARIKITAARLKAEEQGHRVSQERLDRIRSQIENCTIKAPMAGRVVYSGPSRPQMLTTDRRTDKESKLVYIYNKPNVRQGVRVRQGQTILSIRDPEKMQITVSVPASMASQIKQGAPATIRVDAFPDMKFNGAVAKIAKLPAGPPSRSQGKSGREATISIQNPQTKLRAGLTAEVTIQAEKD